MDTKTHSPKAGLDFTLVKYAELCRTVAGSSYKAVTLADYLAMPRQAKNRYLIMRHDVDRMPARALGTAEVEHRHNIRATYYFRQQKNVYVPEIMDRISEMGHEIGFHYETLDKSRGDKETARTLFAKELAGFRQKYDVRTVCAHGNPLTTNDNKDIWDGAEFAAQGLLGEAFLSLDFSQFAYFSDSGRTWLKTESQKMPGKDSVATAFDHIRTKDTDDVIRVIREGILPNICVLTHPERWSSDFLGYISRFFLDLAFSWGKVAIHAYRRAGSGENNIHN